MPVITKELAIEIAKKLKAEMTRKGPHDVALVKHAGKLIAHFGIRHGSRKGSGHDHVPGDIHVGPHHALLLGQCPMKREAWIQEMIDKGFIT